MNKAVESLPYLNPDLPLEDRVRDLISRMTLTEKLSQMTFEAQAIPRLGIPFYNYWGEALHGVARNGRATVFPQAIGMAATWDPQLIQQAASAIGDEARAKYHELLRQGGKPVTYQSLTFWSPNVNIFRDPRWGRGQETWGEDPTLTGEMGAAFVRGLQGDDPRYLKAAACAKHYAVHSGPEKMRHGFDARVSEGDLRTTYLPAFKKLVKDAHVEAVMGAYNRTNGEACCASPTLLEQILRQEWGFKGHVVSDCGAVGDIYQNHQLAATPVEAAAQALLAGCDLECGNTYDHLFEALEMGLISETDIDHALARSLATRFKLGLFDPSERVPYAAIPLSVIDCEAHNRLAYQTALESVVLLKNNGILPIRKDVRKICVLGPNAATIDALLGNYYGLTSHFSTLLEGIVGAAPEGIRVTYLPGCTHIQPDAKTHDWSPFEAGHSDVTIACMGLSRLIEGEEGDAILSAESGDRSEIELPAVQAEYIRKLAKAGAKTVLVLAAGSPIALGDLADLVDAIVYVWYPGQEGGRALADVLFGKESPSGKLPVSFPRSTADLPPFEDYSMACRTYRYAETRPQFPFGFGLSYTTFEYSNLTLSHTSITHAQSVEVRVTLRNTGEMRGAEVAQVYLSYPAVTEVAPRWALAAFQRVELEPGEQRQLIFNLSPQLLTLWNEQGQAVQQSGLYTVRVGGCSPVPFSHSQGIPQVISVTISVEDL